MTQGDQTYRFVKVEDYFTGYRSWQTLGAVKKCVFDKKNKAISLTFEKMMATVVPCLFKSRRTTQSVSVSAP